jgi:hypothetical protein
MTSWFYVSFNKKNSLCLIARAIKCSDAHHSPHIMTRNLDRANDVTTQRRGHLRFQRPCIRIEKPATIIVEERNKFDSIFMKNSRVAFRSFWWALGFGDSSTRLSVPSRAVFVVQAIMYSIDFNLVTAVFISIIKLVSENNHDGIAHYVYTESHSSLILEIVCLLTTEWRMN